MDSKKCKRNGCKRAFNDNDNHEQACNYHPGKPIFHDLKKGWTCCNQIVYDWDEFEKLKTCAVGKHSDTDQQGQNEFYQSNTVQNAEQGLNKFKEGDQVVKSIDDYNKEQAEKKKQEEEELAKKVKKIFITPNGKYKCIHKGCLKEYDPNEDTTCNYHPGEPIFHDLKKSWSCCKIVKYDWDEFVKIPTCSIGHHEPKLV